ncbi:hypothetical protein DFH11DRAFT_1732023 [Phellopilus nigrolimitatus]|nr:hypothetical protein DFH11DRAFT_1732023 [Phellopilus nigrolimitatus]
MPRTHYKATARVVQGSQWVETHRRRTHAKQPRCLACHGARTLRRCRRSLGRTRTGTLPRIRRAGQDRDVCEDEGTPGSRGPSSTDLHRGAVARADELLVAEDGWAGRQCQAPSAPSVSVSAVGNNTLSAPLAGQEQGAHTSGTYAGAYQDTTGMIKNALLAGAEALSELVLTVVWASHLSNELKRRFYKNWYCLMSRYAKKHSEDCRLRQGRVRCSSAIRARTPFVCVSCVRARALRAQVKRVLADRDGWRTPPVRMLEAESATLAGTVRFLFCSFVKIILFPPD